MDGTGVCGRVSASGLSGSRGTPPGLFTTNCEERAQETHTRRKKSLRRNLCVTELDPDMSGWELEMPWEGENYTPCPLKPREVLEVQRSILRVPSQVVALITVPPW